MPLNTEVLRDGKPRTDIAWDYFALSCMYTVAIKEGAPDHVGLLRDEMTFGDLEEGQWIDFSMTPIYYLEVPGCKLIEKGSQKVKNRHVFNRNRTEDDEGNPIEPDLLIFEPGDVLQAWRSYK